MTVHVLDHPLCDAWITDLRDVNTGTELFRKRARAISAQLTWAAVAGRRYEPRDVTTPLCDTTGVATPEPPTIVAVIRAGLAMVDGVRDIVGDGPLRPAGVRRDHDTLQVDEYLQPGAITGDVIICDPMLATGASLLTVGAMVERSGAERVCVLSIVAAPEGLAAVAAERPDWDIWVGTVDDHLDERAYIVPGLGDAGDRWAG